MGFAPHLLVAIAAAAASGGEIVETKPARQPHERAIISYAHSPDGRLLATGSGGDYSGDEMSVGLCLWTVRTGALETCFAVRGGVGLGLGLADGLQFSDDGETLVFAFDTNRQGILDVRRREVRHLVGECSYGGQPDFVTIDRGATLAIASTETCPRTAGGVLVQTEAPYRTRCLAKSVVDDPFVIYGDRSALVTMQVGSQARLITYRRRDLTMQRQTKFTDLPRMHGPVSGRWAVLMHAVDSKAPRRFAVVDVRTHRHVLDGVAKATDHVERVVFHPATRRAIVVSRRGPRTVLTLHVRGSPPVELGDDFTPWKWDFADGIPASFDVKGHELVLLKPGSLEVWNIARAPRRVRAISVRGDFYGVAWPQSDRATIIGPKTLAVVDPKTGRIVARRSLLRP